MINLMLGNCIDTLKTLEPNSVDSIVCDPPYGLSFMNKGWDYSVPTAEMWREALRVLKPGGYLLAFGGTRTYHRLVVAIEDAGFEIRDQIQWLYGQGFPKSMDISKAIDKEAGAVRDVVRDGADGKGTDSINALGKGLNVNFAPRPITAPATDEAKRWAGYGTALKPANEPICLARKPLSEKTVAKNVLKHGTGGLNIDAGRIGGGEARSLTGGNKTGKEIGGSGNSIHFGLRKATSTTEGRFPSNVILDESAAAVLDDQTQHLHGAGSKREGGKSVQTNDGALFGIGNHAGNGMRLGDSGGASRFFYVAKASKSDRNKGLEGSDIVNNHATVKPIKLMEYLVKLVTPEGGTVLDPFMGSGTTGVAAKNLGFNFVGCELDANYFEIAKQRIES